MLLEREAERMAIENEKVMRAVIPPGYTQPPLQRWEKVEKNLVSPRPWPRGIGPSPPLVSPPKRTSPRALYRPSPHSSPRPHKLEPLAAGASSGATAAATAATTAAITGGGVASPVTILSPATMLSPRIDSMADIPSGDEISCMQLQLRAVEQITRRRQREAAAAAAARDSAAWGAAPIRIPRMLL